MTGMTNVENIRDDYRRPDEVIEDLYERRGQITDIMVVYVTYDEDVESNKNTVESSSMSSGKFAYLYMQLEHYVKTILYSGFVRM